MSTSGLPLFDAIHRKLDWLSSRQAVLSQNIANADTPNYQSRDLKELSFKDILKSSTQSAGSVRLKPVQTHASHAVSSSRDDTFRSKKQKNANDVTLDNNKVSIEEQLMRVGQTQMDHQLMISLLKKHTDMMKTAVSIRV